MDRGSSGGSGGRRTHVVVGAGPSGIMLVNLLLHHGDNVILLERGDECADADEDSQMAIDWSKAAKKSRHSAKNGTILKTEAQQNMMGRELRYPLGYGLGGSSNINACIWTGGSPEVFNRYWPKSWNSTRMEHYLNVARKALEDKGLLSTSTSSPGLPISILERGIQYSHKVPREEEDTFDFTNDRYKTNTNTASTTVGVDSEDVVELEENSEHRTGTEGVGTSASCWSAPSQSSYFTTTTSTALGKRSRLGDLLRDHSGDGKLTIRCNARVAFVMFRGKEAIGVVVEGATTGGSYNISPKTDKYPRSGVSGMTNPIADLEMAGFEVIRPSGGGEIVLCAGTVGTADLLIASGLRGAVHSHPASNCGVFPTVADDGKVRGGGEEDEEGDGKEEGAHGRRKRRKKKEKEKGRERSSSSRGSKGRGSPLPHLPAIGSRIQDHVVIPMLALGRWHWPLSSSSLSSSESSSSSLSSYSSSS